ncbi:pimeloyl-ACP methyl ester carboxylesterase [Nonomuraea thailandensis]|uniref:Pimeloyl-ACP methyl ester carboxylesterase n=1 Tax=Nonomuraea thailandensis TaxID=1188745 RepID=A0A9X2K2P9_9ACTN|nr:alpha/beta fold hydrolase [Nonomuraea thailandensis]MCP2358627.1 pimeloyl-ACP methyl ester carboxylesterase [Nonomuraea thailandensis]
MDIRALVAAGLALSAALAPAVATAETSAGQTPARVTAIGASAGEARATAGAFVVAAHECARATARCDGTVSVPLNWSDPSSERIEVAFAWLPATGRATGRATGTVVANPGGPLPALPALPRVREALGPVLEQHNLLVVDPRGLGKSSPLRCPGLKLTEPDTIAACAARLGPRIGFYTADQAAHDLDAVRRALGAGPVTFYGNSYGTVYAQAYAARHPEGLAAAFLDSTTITSPGGYALWPMRSRPDLMGFVCERSRACRALPGGPGRTYARLVARLREHPDPEVPLLALRSVERMTEPVFGREANAAATAYLAGDPEPLRRLARVLKGAPAQPVEGPEWAGYLAYRCGDGAFPYDRDASPGERLAQLGRYHERERPLAPYTPADLGLDVRSGLEFCVNWPTPRHSPVLPPRAALPAMPVLVAGGDFDTQTPAEVARAMRAFPRATFVRVPFGTHSLAWGAGEAGECVRTMLRSFVTDHRVPRERCGAENYRAAGAFPRSLDEVEPVPAADLDAGPGAGPDAGPGAGPDVGLDVGRRRVLAAVYATAADAVARRNPYNLVHARLTTQPGLRGGQVAFGNGTIDLDRAAFVPGVAVSGRITLAPDGRATASLGVTEAGVPGGAAHRIELEWEAFTARERPALSGSFDGTRFEARERR